MNLFAFSPRNKKSISFVTSSSKRNFSSFSSIISTAAFSASIDGERYHHHYRKRKRPQRVGHKSLPHTRLSSSSLLFAAASRSTATITTITTTCLWNALDDGENKDHSSPQTNFEIDGSNSKDNSVFTPFLQSALGRANQILQQKQAYMDDGVNIVVDETSCNDSDTFVDVNSVVNIGNGSNENVIDVEMGNVVNDSMYRANKMITTSLNSSSPSTFIEEVLSESNKENATKKIPILELVDSFTDRATQTLSSRQQYTDNTNFANSSTVHNVTGDNSIRQNANEIVLDLVESCANRSKEILSSTATTHMDNSEPSNLILPLSCASEMSTESDTSTSITTTTTTTTITTTTTVNKTVTTSEKQPKSSLTNATISNSVKSSTSLPSNTSPPTPKNNKEKRIYLNQPAVTSTALAHMLWSQVLIPYQDTVIDATCGNGKDSLVLANLLFPQSSNVPSFISPEGNEDHEIDTVEEYTTNVILPELICIDIQSCATSNTTELLQSNLPSNIMSTSDNNGGYIRVLQMSHDENLGSIPKDKRSVGLICYNLGWLPGSGSSQTSSKLICTEMNSTLQSLVDAVRLLRVGGLLSVMTYPGSGKMEALAVSLFCESLAMFTSKEQKKKGGWEAFIDDYGYTNYDSGFTGYDDDFRKDGNEDFDSMKELVKENVRVVWMEGDEKQTWRVFEHNPKGRPLSPILVTAMRIK